MTLAPLRTLSDSAAKRVKAVFTDIDDTLTTEGLLPADAYAALWKLHEAGIAVVPVTGRPAGWCDHFARMWPVAGVVGENGAFYLSYDRSAKKMRSRYVLSEAERATLQKRLARLGRKILKAVPGAGIASDQPYRIHDLAVDFCEDVDPLSREDIDRIVAIFEKAGATAKVSSIHVNGWFGTWDKVTMIRHFAQDILQMDLDATRQNNRALYVGDSPNDEPAFAYFRKSVGVANIMDFADRLDAPPAYVTRGHGGTGFAQVARKLLRAKKS